MIIYLIKISVASNILLANISEINAFSHLQNTVTAKMDMMSNTNFLRRSRKSSCLWLGWAGTDKLAC